MTEAAEFYVYEHWRPDTGLPFYVGKGARNRANAMVPRSRHHNNIVNKIKQLGLIIEVRKIFTHLDEATSLDLERATISYWRSHGIKLINSTDGGDGTSGYRCSVDQKAQRSLAAKERWKRPEYRANVTAASKAAVSRPEVRAKMLAAKNNPATKASTSAFMKARWGSPDVREKWLAAINAPEVVAKRVATRKTSWTDEQRKNASSSTKAMWADSEKRSQLLIAFNQPNLAERHRANLKKILVRPDVVGKRKETEAKRIEALRIRYQDPEMRRRIGDAVKAARSSPDVRAEMSRAAKLAWARRRALATSAIPNKEQ
jgi:hypothetical protein